MSLSMLPHQEDENRASDCMTGTTIESDNCVVLRHCLVTNYNRLYQRLLRHLGCPDLASDCLHDAWLRLAEVRISSTIQSPYSYVYQVASNLAMDRLRNRKARHDITDAEGELDRIADTTPGPEVIAQACSDLEEMARAFKGLPPRHQLILVALRIEEQSRQEVANQHGVSSRRVDTLLRQALDYCAAEIGQVVAIENSTPRRGLPLRGRNRAAMATGRTPAMSKVGIG